MLVLGSSNGVACSQISLVLINGLQNNRRQRVVRWAARC